MAVIVALAWSGASAQTGIGTVVKLVEAHYGVRHQGVPLLWLAKPFLLGSGVGGLKIAIFESFRLPAEQWPELKQEMVQALGPEWSLFVESRSKGNGERLAIYALPHGHGMKMLIVSAENNELSVLQMKVSGKRSRVWFDEPVKSARGGKPGRGQDSKKRAISGQ